MKSQNSLKTKYSYRRFIIQHDPMIGYRFIPNIYSRVKHKNNAFIIQTNKQGFRDNISFDELNNGRLNVVAIGDSYVAGDGISNYERFMNILSERFNINVLNMGLPGSGTDQQLLIQEKIASQWHYDILVFVPCLYNLGRNLKSQMEIWDWATKIRLDIRKPYFELIDGKLELHNTPVSLSKDFFIDDTVPENVSSNIRRILRLNIPTVHKLLRRLKAVYYNLAYRSNLIKAYPDFASRDSYGWQLMRAIVERMIQNAGTRFVVIIPLPLHAHIRFGARPYYLDRFQELARSNVHVVDILPSLKSAYKEKKEALFVPDDGHFSAIANEIIADVCSPLFSRLIEVQNTD